MANQHIGGVQAHSVGPHYPVVVVGYGDGTWRAEYGGARSGPVKTSAHARLAASAAHHELTAHGHAACTAWLSGFATTVERVAQKPVSETTSWILGGARIDVYLQLTNADGHRQVRSRTFATPADAARFKIAIDVLVAAKVADAVLLALFA